MKNIFSFIVLFISLLSCKAQQTVGIYDGDPSLPEGTYYKDLNNDLDKFTGTWKFEQGNTVLIIILEKKDHVLNTTFNQYEDLIVGEYKYEFNNQVVLDYLYRIDMTILNEYQHNIYGNAILNSTDTPNCEQCNTLERRLKIIFKDPEREYIPSNIVLRHQTINGVEQLTAILGGSSSYAVTEENLPSQPRVPYGTYVLIKQ